MPPLRRYLRITRHSVLEVRIYLDRPADADAWLLKRDNPALPRVIQAVRPLVLPKLREENERGKGRGGAKAKKKGVKDVVIEGQLDDGTPVTGIDPPDDFEVSIFLTDLSSRHSVLTKQKIVKDKPRIRSNSSKLTNWLTGSTIELPVPLDGDESNAIVIREEEEEDDMVNLANIPEAGAQKEPTKRSARNQRQSQDDVIDVASYESDSDDSALFISGRPDKQRKTKAVLVDGPNQNDLPEEDKKKLGLNTLYDGFSIYGRILCLVVKRRGARPTGGNAPTASSQQMLENWVSTQAAAEQMDDDEDVA